MRLLTEGMDGPTNTVWSGGHVLNRIADGLAEIEVHDRLANTAKLINSVQDDTAMEDRGPAQDSGAHYLQQLYQKLDEIDRLEYPRSHHQKTFHECFTRACLRSIFGDSFEKHHSQLRRDYDVEDFKTEVMIVTPRRFGKTFAVAQYCAAFAASVLGKEIAIFSTGRRASKKMLDLVLRFLRPIMRPTQTITSANVEEVIIFDSLTGKRNKICSYPSKVQVRHPFQRICRATVYYAVRDRLLLAYKTRPLQSTPIQNEPILENDAGGGPNVVSPGHHGVDRGRNPFQRKTVQLCRLQRRSE